MSEPLSFARVLAEHVPGFSSVVYCAGDAECDWVADFGGARGVVQHRTHLDSVLREHVREAVEGAVRSRAFTVQDAGGVIRVNDLRALIGDRR